MNAFSSSQKTLENVRALEAFLQSQVLVETIMVDLYRYRTIAYKCEGHSSSVASDGPTNEVFAIINTENKLQNLMYSL